MDAKSNEKIKREVRRVKPEPEALAPLEVFKLGQSLRRDPRYYTLYNMLFLTGQRISEALALTGRDIKFNWINDKRTDEIIPSIAVHSITLKNRRQHTRDLIINDLWQLDVRSGEYVSRPHWDMWQSIEGRINKVIETDPNLKIWGDITRQSAKNFFRKYIEFEVPAYDDKKRKRIDIVREMYPHYLRHCRATDLGAIMDIYQLTYFFGWSKPDMALRYVHRATPTI